jgi:hypothetical protein
MNNVILRKAFVEKAKKCYDEVAIGKHIVNFSNIVVNESGNE